MEEDLESNCDFNMRMKKNEQWFQQCLEAICEKYNKPFEEDVIVDLDSMTYESSTGVHPWKGEVPRETSEKEKNVKRSSNITTMDPENRMVTIDGPSPSKQKLSKITGSSKITTMDPANRMVTIDGPSPSKQKLSKITGSSNITTMDPANMIIDGPSPSKQNLSKITHSGSDKDENIVQTAIYRKFPVDYLSQDKHDKRRYAWVKCDEMSVERPECSPAKDSSFYFSSFVCFESPATNEELKFNLSGSFNSDNYETNDSHNLSSILDLSQVYPLMVAKIKAAFQSQATMSAANAVQRFYRKLMSHKVKARKMAIVQWRLNNTLLKEYSLSFCASKSVAQPFNTKLIASATFSKSPSKIGLLQCDMSALSVSSSTTVKKPLMLEASVKPLALTAHACISPKENKGSPSSPLRVQQLRRTHTEQFMDQQQQQQPPPSSPSSRSCQMSCSFILGTPPRVKQHSDFKKLVQKLSVESSGDSLSDPSSSLQRRHSFSGFLQPSDYEDVDNKFDSLYQKLLSPTRFKSYLSSFDVSDVQRGLSMLPAITLNRKNKRDAFCDDEDKLRKRQRN